MLSYQFFDILQFEPLPAVNLPLFELLRSAAGNSHVTLGKAIKSFAANSFVAAVCTKQPDLQVIKTGFLDDFPPQRRVVVLANVYVPGCSRIPAVWEDVFARRAVLQQYPTLAVLDH